MLPKAQLATTYHYKDTKFEIQGQTADTWIVSNGPDKAKITIEGDDNDARYYSSQISADGTVLTGLPNVTTDQKAAIVWACHAVLEARAERERQRHTRPALIKAMSEYLASRKST